MRVFLVDVVVENSNQAKTLLNYLMTYYKLSNGGVTLMNAYKKYWSNILNFSGTATRSEYWWPAIINAIIAFIAAAVVQNIVGHPITEIYNFADLNYSLGTRFIAFLVWLANWTVTVRRLHDTDRSGWWIVIQIIPLLGTIWFLILMLLPSHSQTRWSN
jgi:uncharacterized membrane protein YhaH (DUF805 family)